MGLSEAKAGGRYNVVHSTAEVSVCVVGGVVLVVCSSGVRCVVGGRDCCERFIVVATHE